MKLKKLLALLLAAVMVVSMAACGTSTESTASTETSAAETEAATQSEAPAEETTAPATSAEEPASTVEEAPTSITCDPVEISFSTVYNETETGGQIIKHFQDYLSELTGGAITMTIYWGGTLFSDAEALDGVSSGSVNMTALGHMPHLATLNYLAFPGFALNAASCIR